MSIVLVILSTFGTIHIRHVNFIARWGVLKTGVDCMLYVLFSTPPTTQSESRPVHLEPKYEHVPRPEHSAIPPSS